MFDFKEKYIGLIGDLHLGKRSEDEWENVYLDLKSWIKETFVGKTNQLMFLGDVFDGRLTKAKEKGATFKLLHFVDKFFEDLSQEFEIFVFSGNHDCYYKTNPEVSAMSLLRNKPNIHVIEQTVDYHYSDKTYRIVPWSSDLGDGKVDSIFAHFDIQTFRLNAHKVSDHGYSSKELFDKCDHVYSGHYHHAQERTYQDGKKLIKYLGTPLQLDWGEAGKDSYIYLFNLKENKIEDQFVNEVSPKHIRILASKVDSSKDIIGSNIVDIVWDRDEDFDESLLDLGDCFSSEFNFDKSNEKHFEDIKNNTCGVDPIQIIEETLEGSDLKEDQISRVLGRSREILSMV